MNDITKVAPLPHTDGHQRTIPNPVHKRALRILKGRATFEDRYFDNHQELVEVVDHVHSMGCVVAFTTGVWDMYHVGHGRYIETGKIEAKKLYPEAELVMVVGIDTDELTKARKGPTRPLTPMAERCEVLGQMREVDIIVPQYEADTLFKLVKHDVRIVSTSTKDLPALDGIKRYCEHLVNLPPQAETSTTAIIRRLAMDGKLEMMKDLRARLGQLIEEMDRGLGTGS